MKKQLPLVCFFIAFIFISSQSKAQYQKEIDSLKAIIPTVIKDTVQLNKLAQLAFYQSFTDSVNTFKNTQQIQQLSAKWNYKPGLAAALRANANFFIVKRVPQKALPYLIQESLIWQQIKRPIEVAANHAMLGQCYTLSADYSMATEQFNKAEQLYKQLNDQKSLGALYHNAGTMLTEKTEPKLALIYLIKSLEIQEQLKDTKTIGLTQNNIGRLFYQTKNYPKAIEYFQKAIISNSLIKDWRNLGIAHVNLANVYVEMNDYSTAMRELNESIDNFTKVDFKRGLQVVYNNLGAMNIRQKNYVAAIPLLQKGLELAKMNQSTAGVALIEQNIGYALYLSNQYEKALEWFTKAEKTAIESKADEYTFGEIYNHRASLDSAMGNYKSGLEFRTKFVAINEKFMGNKVIKEVNELQTKYETQKKEYTISLLNKSDSIKSLTISNQQLAINQNLFKIAEQKLKLADANLQIVLDSLLLSEQNKKILQAQLDSSISEEKINRLSEQNKIKALEVARKNNQIVIALISIGLIALFVYYLYKRKQNIQISIHQKEMLIQQKNATIDIINAEEKERKRIASDLHDGVGQMMSAAYMNLQAIKDQLNNISPDDAELFNKSMSLVKESCDEVRQVSHNMMPNALLVKGLAKAVQEFIGQINQRNLKINLSTEGILHALPSHVEGVLYRVIQESVNNVIKHAMATHLDISINQSEDGIDVMIEDNGKGFENGLIHKEGIGLSNIKSRIHYLGGTVEWNTSLGNGTLVAIYIPLTKKVNNSND
ncbi:ATP-binding protein [Sediminibacterium sp. TEGAF015]|uniref:ATP-binding protein n=1 Tax=Sediminibacterium sp. TEGAF015 TaxID=575378 RepID=UPI002209D045|nr:sensor histidine kinase [Sediminibacterium sp. TEGAF015]BDQ11458.1 hypothetical protein TEGAF0_06750 [Sediminibacterium sp. TEGAF015]